MIDVISDHQFQNHFSFSQYFLSLNIGKHIFSVATSAILNQLLITIKSSETIAQNICISNTNNNATMTALACPRL